jgi:spore maturation protein SpmA
MLNAVWLGLVLGAVVWAAWAGNMQAVSQSIFDSARSAVDLVIGLTGTMVVFLGLMGVARRGGLLRWIAHVIAPVMRRLFPDVPPDHPAMGAMVMNFATNMLGLGNAATPFGLKAMVELDRLNPYPGVATNAMVLFLAINTSAITLMAPTGTISIRAAAGSADPFAIWIPTLIATTCSTLGAILTFYLLRDRARFAARPLEGAEPERPANETPETGDPSDLLGEADEVPLSPPRRIFVGAVVLVLLVMLARELQQSLGQAPLLEVVKTLLSGWLFPLLVVGLLLVGVVGRVRVYEAMVEGGREGLEVAVRILPYLVAILVAVGMFRASGALDLLIGFVSPVTDAVGIPAEALPIALLRPLSATGAFGLMAEILETHGPDSFVGYFASTVVGSTETTFYVLTLYCGAAGIRDIRHALLACLAGDVAGLAGATVACHLFFG